jgi:hypothetical protein
MIPLADANWEETTTMKETVQEYTQRILSKAEGQDPLNVQAETPGKIEALTKGAGAAALSKRPAPDKWSVTEILAHLADCEIVFAWRIRSILGAPGTPLAAFDQDAWASAGHYAQRDPHRSLVLFRILRENNLALYGSLTPEQRQQYGMHAERGKEYVEHLARLMAGHDLNHLQQIERLLAPRT